MKIIEALRWVWLALGIAAFGVVIVVHVDLWEKSRDGVPSQVATLPDGGSYYVWGYALNFNLDAGRRYWDGPMSGELDSGSRCFMGDIKPDALDDGGFAEFYCDDGGWRQLASLYNDAGLSSIGSFFTYVRPTPEVYLMTYRSDGGTESLTTDDIADLIAMGHEYIDEWKKKRARFTCAYALFHRGDDGVCLIDGDGNFTNRPLRVGEHPAVEVRR